MRLQGGTPGLGQNSPRPAPHYLAGLHCGLRTAGGLATAFGGPSSDSSHCPWVGCLPKAQKSPSDPARSHISSKTLGAKDTQGRGHPRWRRLLRTLSSRGACDYGHCSEPPTRADRERRLRYSYLLSIHRFGRRRWWEPATFSPSPGLTPQDMTKRSPWGRRTAVLCVPTALKKYIVLLFYFPHF